MIDYDMKNVYSSNGVLDILCVSGFHVIFLLELVKTLLRKIKTHKTIVTICISFVSQLLKEMKPSTDKEIYLFNKLKAIVEKDEKEKAERVSPEKNK